MLFDSIDLLALFGVYAGIIVFIIMIIIIIIIITMVLVSIIIATANISSIPSTGIIILSDSTPVEGNYMESF